MGKNSKVFFKHRVEFFFYFHFRIQADQSFTMLPFIQLNFSGLELFLTLTESAGLFVKL